MKALYLCKGTDRLVAISDAVRVCGLSDGDYRFADQEIRVREGQARLPSGELAGATVATGLPGFRTLLRVTDCGSVEAARHARDHARGLDWARPLQGAKSRWATTRIWLS